MSPAAWRFHQRDNAVGEIDHAEDVRAEQRSHPAHVDRANLRRVADAGVVDQDVDATHLLDAVIHDPFVVSIDRDIRDHANRTGLAGDGVDLGLVAAGEHHLVPVVPGVRDKSGANSLAAAGNEKSLSAHAAMLPAGRKPRAHGLGSFAPSTSIRSIAGGDDSSVAACVISALAIGPLR